MALPPSRRTSGPFRPTRLGDWQVIAKIAGGGMSAVYLGRRVEPSADIPTVVALKIVRHDVAKDPRLVQMFLEEGKLIARLLHNNIVRTLEVGGDEEQDFIAMELMLGKTFSAIQDVLAARDARLHSDIAAFTAARIAHALHYAHELTDEYGRPLALVHRDVNPANVFATFDGEVKLFDFGLAKITAGEASGSNLLAGKLSYLSPEQIMQMPLDRRSDIFSLGTTLWELLTGKRLFRRESDLDTVRAVQLGPIPDPRLVAPEIPEELARIARTALERNREHRYPSAAHLAHELDEFVFGHTTPSDVASRLAQLVDTLFPGEQKRQSGWLKPTISPSRQMSAVNPSGAPTSRPEGRRETTAVMSSAPTRPSDRPPPSFQTSRPHAMATPAVGPPSAGPPKTMPMRVAPPPPPTRPLPPPARQAPSVPPPPQRPRTKPSASWTPPPPPPFMAESLGADTQPDVPIFGADTPDETAAPVTLDSEQNGAETQRGTDIAFSRTPAAGAAAARLRPKRAPIPLPSRSRNEGGKPEGTTPPDDSRPGPRKRS
jgi:serine/threonine-protein kinase